MQISIAIPLGALVIGAIALLLVVSAARSARRRRRLAKLRAKQEATRLRELEKSMQPASRAARLLSALRKRH